MKLANLHIFQRITLLVAVCAASWAVGVRPGATIDRDAVAVGPARVAFELSTTGRWLALVPDWADGKSILSGGGFVVMATDDEGMVVELANTANGDSDRLREDRDARGRRPVYEGVPGGARYPVAHRDDDGDGAEDEDRLDGVDNDGDGRVDEDFAAIGDQMVAVSFDALDPDGNPLLRFHEELYTWTLPHIDAMVAMKVAVRNIGDRPLHDVSVGALIGWAGEGDFGVSTQDLGPPEGGDERLRSKGILLSETGHTAMAALFFAEPTTENVSWLTGVVSGDRSLSDLVQSYVDASRGVVREESADVKGAAGAGDESETDAPLERRTAYGVSPNLGTLAPGDEVVVYAALVAVPDMKRVDAAIDNAYRTVVGDGTHRMIPPPVSVKRRTVWGTYEIDRAGALDDATPRVKIVLENARGYGIGAGDISYLTGIDLAGVETTETFEGNLELRVAGELYGEIAETGKRAELHGKLKNGEFFDVILTPVDSGPQGAQLQGVSESQYWSRPGALMPELLSGSPNPFRESTTIYYEVPSHVSGEDGGVLDLVNPVQASVKIYNVAGRLVSILVDGIISPGQYNTNWAAVDDAGNGVASGVYYVKLQIGKKHVTKRLIQLK